jgi:hypothetical protein
MRRRVLVLPFRGVAPAGPAGRGHAAGYRGSGLDSAGLAVGLRFPEELM